MLSAYFSQIALCIFIIELEKKLPLEALGPVENHILLLSLSLFYPGEIRSNDSLNGFMVTHNVHFILLALGLKKKCRAWVGRTQLEENKEMIGHQGQCVMEWMKRGSGSLHAEIKSPLPTSLLLCHRNLLEPLPLCVTYFPYQSVGFQEKILG